MLKKKKKALLAINRILSILYLNGIFVAIVLISKVRRKNRAIKRRRQSRLKTLKY
jgi:hypothetical protein